MKHGELCKQIADFLKRTPRCWHYRPVQVGYGRRGIPDFVVCIEGRLVAFEVKVGRDTVKPWQLREMQDIEEAGGAPWVIRSIDDAYDAIKHALQRRS